LALGEQYDLVLMDEHMEEAMTGADAPAAMTGTQAIQRLQAQGSTARMVSCRWVGGQG
jgi:CheY-like chemotaxis protein